MVIIMPTRFSFVSIFGCVFCVLPNILTRYPQSDCSFLHNKNIMMISEQSLQTSTLLFKFAQINLLLLQLFYNFSQLEAATSVPLFIVYVSKIFETKTPLNNF